MIQSKTSILGALLVLPFVGGCWTHDPAPSDTAATNADSATPADPVAPPSAAGFADATAADAAGAADVEDYAQTHAEREPDAETNKKKADQSMNALADHDRATGAIVNDSLKKNDEAVEFTNKAMRSLKEKSK